MEQTASVCMYLPSSYPRAQWVGSLRLEKRFLPASLSELIISAGAATGLFEVHCQEALQCGEHLDPLVSGLIQVLVKKMTQQLKR